MLHSFTKHFAGLLDGFALAANRTPTTLNAEVATPVKPDRKEQTAMFPSTLLIVDLETTGFDPATDSVVELGAILYSVRERCVLQQLSTLFPVEANEAEAWNRIPATASQAVSHQGVLALLGEFQRWCELADYLVAHNAQFDRRWFGNGLLPATETPWVCTYDDFVWPCNPKPCNLVQTALNHGIGVNRAHRALTDCQLIAELFERVLSPELLHDAIERSKDPFVYLVALVNYKDRKQASERDFKWDRFVPKRWAMRVRQSELDNLPPYPFNIEIIPIAPPSPPPKQAFVNGAF